jgi:hypothetical protein
LPISQTAFYKAFGEEAHETYRLPETNWVAGRVALEVPDFDVKKLPKSFEYKSGTFTLERTQALTHRIAMYYSDDTRNAQLEFIKYADIDDRIDVIYYRNKGRENAAHYGTSFQTSNGSLRKVVDWLADVVLHKAYATARVSLEEPNAYTSPEDCPDKIVNDEYDLVLKGRYADFIGRRNYTSHLVHNNTIYVSKTRVSADMGIAASGTEITFPISRKKFLQAIVKVAKALGLPEDGWEIK